MSKVVLPTLVLLAIACAQAEADTQSSNRFYAGIGASILNLKTDFSAPEEGDLDDSFDFNYAYKKRLNLKNGIFQLGYKFSENFSVEGQYSSSMQSKTAMELSTDFDATTNIQNNLANNTTLSNAQIADVKSVKVNIKSTVDLKAVTTAVYAVYRTSGDFYAKFKGGPASINVTKTTAAKATWNKDLATTASPIIKDYLNAAETDFNKYLQESFNSSFDGGEESERKTKLAVGIGAGYKINQNITIEVEQKKIGSDVSTISFTANYYF